MSLTASVIVITLNRPDHVRRCLECLRDQIRKPEQIIVVDASPDDRTTKVVAEFAEALYLRNDDGFGRMTSSRNIGLRHTTGSIIAFVDDDAYAFPKWLEELLACYTDPEIGAVGGRVLGSQSAADITDFSQVGRLRPDGILSGYFSADTGSPRDVDHIMGCNMSFRREVIARLGGFREDYPGISGVCEDSDMSIRVKRLGYRIVFAPASVVDHVAAPQARGQRFDLQYGYYINRNHTLLLVRNFGLRSPMVWRFFSRCLIGTIKDPFKQVAVAMARFIYHNTGAFLGMCTGIMMLTRGEDDPVRHDLAATELSHILSSGHEMTAPGMARPGESPATARSAVQYPRT